MTRKSEKNIKMHSKQTGAIILGVLAFLVIGGSFFVYLANEENKKFEIELQEFIALSCDEIEKDLMSLERWQSEAYFNKVRAGECASNTSQTILVFESCKDLFRQLEDETDSMKRQTIHDKIKKADC